MLNTNTRPCTQNYDLQRAVGHHNRLAPHRELPYLHEVEGSKGLPGMASPIMQFHMIPNP